MQVGIGKYCGDKECAEVLKKFNSPLTVSRLKAYLIGVIAAIDRTPMDQVFDHIQGGQKNEFESMDVYQSFINTIMNLWNHLTKHQDAEFPFELWKQELKPTEQSLFDYIQLRHMEYEEFMTGLLGATNLDEFSDFGREGVQAIMEYDHFLKNTEGLLQSDEPAAHKGDLKSFVESLQKSDAVFQKKINDVILEATSVRRGKMAAIKQREQYRSQGVGRNDPCPCGSGKKYKKCCLQKLH